MNDAQQDMSPDFVLMRLVSAAEYDRLHERDELMSVKAALAHRGPGFDLDSGSSSAGLGSASPHYSSPLPGKGELDGGVGLTQDPGSEAPPSPPLPEDFAGATQRFVDFPVPRGNGSSGHGSRAQLMVFQNLLRSADRILECGVEPPPPGFIQEEQQHPYPGTDTGTGSTTTGPRVGKEQNRNPHCVLSGEENLHPVGQDLQQGHPALDPQSGSGLCNRPRLDLLEQALRLGLLEVRKDDDTVLVLARRLGQLGGWRGEGVDLVLPLPRCSCHVLSSGPGGEDPGDTSDALLVLEGLGSEEVGGGGVDTGEAGSEGAGTLSGLMRQVHRLAEEAGVCTDQTCRSPLGILGSSPAQSRSQLQAAAPKLDPVVGVGGMGRCASPLVFLEAEGVRGEKTVQGKSRKGGSLKVRLSKLFRTKSSSGGSGGLLDKRPSLASSTSSGGSLLDVWGSTCSSTDQDGTR